MFIIATAKVDIYISTLATTLQNIETYFLSLDLLYCFVFFGEMVNARILFKWTNKRDIMSLTVNCMFARNFIVN